MIELSETSSEYNSNEEKYALNSEANFLADEERSGFDADEESFGSHVLRQNEMVQHEFSPNETPSLLATPIAIASDPEISEAAPLSTTLLSTDELPTDANSDSIVSRNESESEITQSVDPTQEAASISAEKASAQFTEPEIKGTPSKSITPAQETSAQTISEAQKLADMLAGAAFSGLGVGSASTAIHTAAEATEKDVTSLSEESTTVNPSKVVSIPSEAEIAREQQRQLRKQELLDYQHRKKENHKIAENHEQRSASRTIAALVMTTLVGAISTAGFFAWRNPALRTSAQEAWSKLVGRDQSGQTVVQNMPATNNANTSANSTISPLDLTQSGTEKTVAAQDSVISTPTAENTIVPSNSGIADSASNGIGTEAKKSNSTEVNQQLHSTQSASQKSLNTNRGENSLSSSNVLKNNPKDENAKKASTQDNKNTNEKVAGLSPEKVISKPISINKNAIGKTSTGNKAEEKINPKTATTPPQTTTKQTDASLNPLQKKSNTSKATTSNTPLSKPQIEKRVPPTLNNGVFAIQVYASPSQQDAEEWVERLRRRGFVNPSMSSQMIRGQVVYRVRFGLYNSLREAEKEAEKYGFAGAWVVRLR